MTTVKRIISSFVAAVLLPLGVSAQFYTAGDDPGRVRWKTVETDNFKLIYPSGMDSLARVYGRNLEKWRMPVGNTAGFYPGEWTKGKIPVVLHGYHAVSNASVAWAPKRMDMFLSPDTDHPAAIPWVTDLTTHEQRHVSQMQTGIANRMRPFGWFFGEMVGAGASVLYGGNTWLEGDATVTETALTESGRGRKASFLNYYMVAFDQGDLRSWWSWKYGSQRWYSPNYYALGYMLLSGVRFNFDMPDISGRRFTDFSNHIFHWGMDQALKRNTGYAQDQVFWQSAGSFYSFWAQQADRRAPYMETIQMVDRPKYYTTYSGLATTPRGLYAVKEGLTSVPTLVRIDSTGREKALRPFSYTGSGLRLSEDGGSLVWSETVLDPRWTLESRSIVRCYDLRTHRTRTLSRKGQMYNPSPCTGGVVASDYRYEGSTGIAAIRGKKDYEKVVTAPDGMQIVETAECGGTVYASAITDGGFSIVKVVGNGLETVLGPQPVTLNELKSREGLLYFTCDRTGVDELYRFDPSAGKLEQMTSTRYGARDYEFSEDGNWLIYAAEGLYGRLVCKTAVEDLLIREVSFEDRYHWEIADTLSAQERRYPRPEVGEVTFTEEKPYRKLPGIMHLHSWAPVYFSYDNIKNKSYDSYYDVVSVGLTGLFQNNLGTSIAEIGYSVHPDPDKGAWRNTGHAKFTYTGWYPVIEASLDFNDRRAHEYGFNVFSEDGKTGYIKSHNEVVDGRPYIKGSLSVYIPWQFNRGGWYRGLIPKVTYRISNDMFCTAPQWYLTQTSVDGDGNTVTETAPLWKGSGWRYPSQVVLASVRGYMIQNTADSGFYPRFGFGVEGGFYTYLAPGGLKTSAGEMPLYSPQAYAYAYMYLPGFTRTQGFKITAKFGTDTTEDSIFGTSIVNTMPRGLEKVTGICASASNSALFTVDYGIPIWIGDCNIGKTFMYIKRLEAVPHFDFMTFESSDGSRGNLFSAGLDLSVRFGNIFFVMAPCAIGIRVDYNGGSSFNDLSARYTSMGHWHIGPLFSMSL